MVYLAPPRIHHCLERIRWRRLNGILLAEKETHVEKKNPYYALLENEEAIEKEKDIHSEIMVVKRVMDRILVGDTDVGRELREQVADLERLLAAYRSGEIIEKV